MQDHHPNGTRPVPATPSLARLDVVRQALLLDLLAVLAHHQEPEAVWAVLATRLKWLLDFERCDVAVVNPDHQTYYLRTVFEARPAVPHVDEARVPLAAGLVGVLLQHDSSSLLLDLSRDQIARLADPWLEGGALASVLTVRVHVHGTSDVGRQVPADFPPRVSRVVGTHDVPVLLHV